MQQLGLLLAAMFAPVNIGYTILLIVVLIYWALVIIGALGIDLFHFDMEVDNDVHLNADLHVDGDMHIHADGHMDVHADGDVHAHADGATEAGADHGGALRGILMFFNLGEVPLMVFVSILVVSMWTISMTTNLLLNNDSLLLGVPILAGNIFVSAFVAKFLTAPIKHLFRALDKDVEVPVGHGVLGKTCVISTSEATEQFGQATIETDGAPLILNVVTFKGETLKKGEEAVVIDYVKEKRVYTVKSRWDQED
jgi:hypothetical protein